LALTLTRGLLLGGRPLVLLALAWAATPSVLAAAAIAVTLAETARIVIDFGIEIWLVRAIATASTHAEQVAAAHAGLLIRATTASLGACIVAAIGLGLLRLNGGLASAAALLTFSGLISGVPVAVLQARLQLQRLFFSLVPLLAAGIAIVLFGAYRRIGPTLLLTMLSGFELLAAAVALGQAGLVTNQLPLPGRRDLVRLTRACAPIAAFNAIVGLHLRLDLWTLSVFAPASVATYTVAFRLYQPASLVVASVAGVLYASIARSLGAGLVLQFTAKRGLALGTLLLSLGIAFLVTGSWVMRHFYMTYPAAAPLIPVLATLVPIVGFNGIGVAVLYARAQFATLIKLAAFNLTVFAFALLMLVPTHGASGAAWSLLVAELGNLGALTWFVSRKHPAAGTRYQD